MPTTTECAALMIAAPASGQGKTTITAALARLHARAGARVCVMKVGPDFLDPALLEAASGNPVYQLDLWMMGEDECRTLVARAMASHDLVLIEGVMGAYDGSPSSVDLARRFDIPVLYVIDGSAMAETFAAIAQGLCQLDEQARSHGVIANRIRTPSHAEMLQSRMRDKSSFLGWVPPMVASLPERQLGLKGRFEIDLLDTLLDQYADALGNTQLTRLDQFPRTAVTTGETSGHHDETRPLAGKCVAIARDAAFRFLYQRNIECLQTLGAEVVYFSPIKDKQPPEADAYYFPGGYPELHAKALSDNTTMRTALKRHAGQGRVLFGECGGMMYLCECLIDSEGARHPMVGIFPGTTRMQPTLVNLAYERLETPLGEIRGHSFHYSSLEHAAAPQLTTQVQRYGQPEGIFVRHHCVASYVHWYFPSCLPWITALFSARLPVS